MAVADRLILGGQVRRRLPYFQTWLGMAVDLFLNPRIRLKHLSGRCGGGFPVFGLVGLALLFVCLLFSSTGAHKDNKLDAARL